MSKPLRSKQRRDEILETAIDLASARGLATLSIGSLAEAVGMSKSGLFAHFGSKEDLQLATIDRAAAGFVERVLGPAADAEPGLPRLRALVLAWYAYVEAIAYSGGCFFDAASSEFSSQPGAVRDELAKLCGHWRDQLEEQARLAVRLGELSSDADPATLAFQLHAYAGEANWSRELLADANAWDRARAAADATLGAAAPLVARSAKPPTPARSPARR